MKCNKKLSDIAEISVGFPFQSKLFNQNYEGFKLIRGKNVGKGFLHWGKDAMYYANVESINKNYIMKENDVVLAMDGNVVDNKSLVRKKDLPSFLVQRVARLRAKDGIDQLFLWYIVNTHQFEQYVNGIKTGTTIQHISAKQIGDFRLDVPNLETQKKIVRILSVLDKKIELNNRQNSLITELLKLNYEKTTRGSNAKTKVALQDIFNFQEGPGIRNWQYVEKDGTRFINIRCIKDDDLDLSTANMISVEEANGKYVHFMLKEGDIVVSTSGTLGRSQIIRKAHLPLCLNTSVIRFWPKEPYYYSFMYCYIISSEFLHKLDVMATGSAQRNFGPMHLRQIDIDIMDNDAIKLFEKENRPLIKKLCLNRDENISLKNIRDTLLPKLMSDGISLENVSL